VAAASGRERERELVEVEVFPSKTQFFVSSNLNRFNGVSLGAPPRAHDAGLP